MSRLSELIRQAKEKDPEFGGELEREYRVLSNRRAFGLNFERHRPEAVELPQRPVRRGDKVRVLPPRGSTEPKSGGHGDQRLWRVTRIEKVDGERHGHLDPIGTGDREPTVMAVDDLVVVAEFRDPIHPGLVSTGTVQRGGDKPAHTVINGENFHALKALSYTHKGKVDAIYIDPPYNTGARDWTYNNDYVEADDLYRHSKWLAFMERRLLLAKELLNPDESVLIVTIDEHEVHRLRSLLDQTFPDASHPDGRQSSSSPRRSLSEAASLASRSTSFYCFVGDVESARPETTSFPTRRDAEADTRRSSSGHATAHERGDARYERLGACSIRSSIDPRPRRIARVGRTPSASESRRTIELRPGRMAARSGRQKPTVTTKLVLASFVLKARWRSG
ncbi:MAG: DNA methyltransferase [Acidimicrobiales bacterium]|nr:DNA methyltransferase [Acidimicrobiales bacterium]